MTLLFFLLATVAFGAISYRLQWLSAGGSIVASAFGFCLLWLGGWPWVVPLLLFFGTSSILSKMGKGAKLPKNDEKKDDIRNATQVLSNGGIAWVLLLVYAVTGDVLWYAGFVGSLAAATSDTWATEIGRLAGGRPRNIISGKMLEKGLSGGVTWQGTAGSALGALLIGLSCVPFYDNTVLHCIILGLFSGLAGSLLDSILGATVQAKYRVPETGEIVEGGIQDQGVQKISGARWVTNDLVNVFCTIAGGVAGILLGYLFT